MRVSRAIDRLSLSRIAVIAMLTLGLALIATACGTKGYAPPLGATTHAILTDTKTSQSLGDATFTPLYAMHTTIYYKGVVVPTTGAQTPAQLRKGSCFGEVVAPLTDGTPEANTIPATTQPVASGGVYVALQPSADWYITILERPNDATAPVVACGHPLSERRQFFDLYPPAVGNGGTALGAALVEPITATRVHFALQSGASPVAQWVIHAGSCAGPAVDAHTSGADSIVFSVVGSNTWLTTQLTDGRTTCGQVKS